MRRVQVIQSLDPAKPKPRFNPRSRSLATEREDRRPILTHKTSRTLDVEKAYKPLVLEPKPSISAPKSVLVPEEEDVSPTPIPDQPCSLESCMKCSSITKKLKKEAESSRNLQRQNGCLEGIITQKRTLVEQLSRQVRTLMKENIQLARSLQKMSPKPQDDSGTSDPSSASHDGPETDGPGTPSEPSVRTKSKTKRSKSSKDSAVTSRSLRKLKKTPTPSTDTDLPEEAAEEVSPAISSLNSIIQVLEEKLKVSGKENEEIHAFLTDLLYTLNARGYETVTDHKGNVVDLYRCRGDHLLDLKGRDARSRPPVKKLVQQENLLKAVIGSQERFIQGLMAQLQLKQKDNLLGKRLSSSHGDSSIEDTNRISALEGEILALVNLLQCACQRSSDVYLSLREQQQELAARNGAGNLIIEAALDRHERDLNETAATSRQRAREKVSSRSHTPPPHRRSSSGANSRRQPSDTAIAESGPGAHAVHGGSRYHDNIAMLNLQKNPYGPIPSHTQLRSFRRRHSTSREAQGIRLRAPSTTSKYVLDGPSSRLRPLVPGPASRTRPSTCVIDGSRKRNLVSECNFCGERFPPGATLAEINAHIELHVYQGD